ncbi:MAG: GNAT family N-acetyltransferase [Bacteroidales bacterium]|nr:GNAT family N-acetyltransferase [Bacteroidales bacterium]
MIRIIEYNASNKLEENKKSRVVDFLFAHLEQFGDPKQDINKAIDYAFSGETGKGGFVLVGYGQDNILGAVVMNNTGMQGYIPEYILVYIATHNSYRGQGIGKQLMQAAIDNAEGNIALHVEHDNPALHLYKKLGFTNKYLEMRLAK